MIPIHSYLPLKFLSWNYLEDTEYST